MSSEDILSRLPNFLPERVLRQFEDTPLDKRVKQVCGYIEGEAIYKAMQKTLVDRYSRHFHTLFDNGEFDEIFVMLKDVRDRAEKIVDEKNNPEWWLITVNCDYNRVSLCDFKKAVEKMVSKKWVVEHHYAFEQRGNGSEAKPVGTGYHVHALIKRAADKTKTSEIVREMKVTLSKVCDSKNPEILNFRKLHAESDVLSAWDYINGRKDVADEKAYKLEALANDKDWRKTEGLIDLYQSVEHPSFLVRDADSN